jgi:hypothetical protein
MLPSGPTSAQSGHRAVPARERARHPSAVAPADPPSTFWAARRSARPDRFTGMIGCCASYHRKHWHPVQRIGSSRAFRISAVVQIVLSTESVPEPGSHDRRHLACTAGSSTDLFFVRQPLTEQTPRTGRLRALRRDPDARVSVADLFSRVPRNVRNSAAEPSGRFTSGERPEAILMASMRGLA